MQLNDWNGLSADEKDGFVTNLVEYGTDFVAPLYSVVEKIEETLQEKNSTIRAQADVRPVDMVLHCPNCGLQHIDKPDDLPLGMPHLPPNAWHNPPHRSHLCAGCGHIWRPADVPTNGVLAVKTKGQNDSPITGPDRVDDAHPEASVPGLSDEDWDDMYGWATYTKDRFRREVTVILTRASAATASPDARIEELRKGLFEARDAMRVMSNWVKQSDPAGHSWGVHMVDRANAVLSGASAATATPSSVRKALQYALSELGKPPFGGVVDCTPLMQALIDTGGIDMNASAATVAEPSKCKRCEGVGTFLGGADGYDDETCDTCGGTGKQQAKHSNKAFKVVTWRSATDREFATRDEALAYIRSNAPNDWHIEPNQAAQQQPEPSEARHPISGQTLEELWLETGKLRAQIADMNAVKAPHLGEPRVLICPTCGDKRCPRASNSYASCTSDVFAQQKQAEPQRYACRGGSMVEDFKGQWIRYDAVFSQQQAEPGADWAATHHLLNAMDDAGFTQKERNNDRLRKAAAYLLAFHAAQPARIGADGLEKAARAICESIAKRFDQMPGELWREYQAEFMSDAKAALLAAQSGQRAGVADGWQLVPVEPTEEMLRAADEGDREYSVRNFGDGVVVRQGPYDHWVAMLAAAPTHHTDQS